MFPSEVTNLTSEINDCIIRLSIMEKDFRDREMLVKSALRFLESLYICLVDIVEEVSKPVNHQYREKVAVCLSQLFKMLFCFMRLAPYRTVFWYLCSNIKRCLEELNRVLGGGATPQDYADSDSSGAFLRGCDQVLDLLHSHGPAVPQSWQGSVDEVIRLALIVAEVSSKLDFNEIASACQKLLVESRELFQVEANKLSPSEVDLLVDSIAIDVATLEHRVSMGVLSIFFEVFPNASTVLKQIVICCCKDQMPRNTADIDHLINRLDILIERVLTVAQFVVPDSSNTISGKSAMASLESLDNCLVPALLSFYSDPSRSEKKAFAKLLSDLWQQEVEQLYLSFVETIDPTAFIKVAIDHLLDLREKIQAEKVKGINLQMRKKMWFLFKFLKRSTQFTQSYKVRFLWPLEQELKLFYSFRKEEVITEHSLRSNIDGMVNRLKIILESNPWDAMNPQLKSDPDGDRIRLAVDGYEFRDPLVSTYLGSIREFSLRDSFRSLTKPDISEIRPARFEEYFNNMEEGKVTGLGDSSVAGSSASESRAVMETPREDSTGRLNVAVLTPFLKKQAERNTPHLLYEHTPRKVVQAQLEEEPTDTISSTPEDDDDDGLKNISFDDISLELSIILDNLKHLSETLAATKEYLVWDDEEHLINRPQVTAAQGTGAVGPADASQAHSSAEGAACDPQEVSDRTVSSVSTPERERDLLKVAERIRLLQLQENE